MALSIRNIVYFDGANVTSKSSQPYAKKKPHIDAYRRRQSATKAIKKLEKIIDNSSVSDLEPIRRGIEKLVGRILDLNGFWDGIPKSGERKETSMDKKIKAGAVDVEPVIRYICPKCHKAGFLFSPNLNLSENELKRYMLHIEWPSKETHFCELPDIRKKDIAIMNEPVEGILTMSREGIVLML
jgi:hypothetical protein